MVRVERTASRSDALTAARAASLALFRELFPGEMLAPGQLATVSTVTFLVTALDPAQADALYQDLGDARAFGVIHEHFRAAGRRDPPGRRGGGQDAGRGRARVVQRRDRGGPDRAGTAAPARRRARRRARFACGSASTAGPTLAATLNDQLDYFGTTARQAAGILAICPRRRARPDPGRGGRPRGRRPAERAPDRNRGRPGRLAGHPHVIRVRLTHRGPTRQ